MSKSIFQLAEHPWLSLLIVALAEAVGQLVAGVLIVAGLGVELATLYWFTRSRS